MRSYAKIHDAHPAIQAFGVQDLPRLVAYLFVTYHIPLYLSAFDLRLPQSVLSLFPVV